MIELFGRVLGKPFGGFSGNPLPTKLIFNLLGSAVEELFCSQLLSQQLSCVLATLHSAITGSPLAGKLRPKIPGALLGAILSGVDLNQSGGQALCLPFNGLACHAVSG